MFQALFGASFNPTKCKTQLRLCVSRIKLLQNKEALTIRQQRKDIAKLLASGKEDSARIRVEALIQEQSCSIAYEILELYCELLSVRVQLMKMNKSLPEDMQESVASIIYAAQRCSAQLPELQVVKDQLQAKYGRDYVTRAQSDETCTLEHVNPRVVESLAIKVPSPKVKVALLSEIALEYNVDWEVVTVPDDATESQSEAGKDEGSSGRVPTQPTAYPNFVEPSYPKIQFSDDPVEVDVGGSGGNAPQGIAVGTPVHPGEASSSQGTPKGMPQSPGSTVASAPVLMSQPPPPAVAAPAPESDDCCGKGKKVAAAKDDSVPDLPDTPSPLNLRVVDVPSRDEEENEMDDLAKRLDALKTGAQLPKPPKDL